MTCTKTNYPYCASLHVLKRSQSSTINHRRQRSTIAPAMLLLTHLYTEMRQPPAP